MDQQAPVEVEPAGVDHCRLFYEPVVLEQALQVACRDGQEVFNGNPKVDNDSLATQAQVFRYFVEKLAQVCDNERGGKTVTSFAVLNSPEGPEFVFGSNDRDANELSETQQFAESLLTLVGQNPTGLKPKALAKQVLWKILLFNLPRVGIYLDKLGGYLHACIGDCDRREAPDVLKSELLRLKEKVEFPRDFASGSVQDKFLSDCEKLIKVVVSIKNTQIEQAIMRNAKDGEISRSQSWCELRHYLGRLLSFRQAADAIIGAHDRLPILFQDFKITPIPSSEAARKPIAKSKSFTAASIIRNMIPDDEEEQKFYLEQATEMQKFGLDAIIQKQISRRTFRPRVHAEVLVHSYLLGQDLQHPREYWNSWKYIGSSKPTCRLCSYYFGAHPDRVQVRKSHFNLYTNWRLPGVFEGPDSVEPDTKTLHLLQQITERVHDDVKRTLEEKRPVGKNHDSNTYSTLPPGFPRYAHSDTASISEVVAQLNEMNLDRHINGQSHLLTDGGDDGFSMIGDAEVEAAAEGNEGVPVTSVRPLIQV
ncbi:hypothetical protein CORC01_07600 [Colletotrichum orchidophilum]|uniref:Uncharacterized protein n=1 Tax=Colletotrichum orchidophilum TaxID=1209926 RepID=A0A1G4B6T8_9PEZI|nr:uncharacterized protein CORC01_07600 [Colletotrichum orchidophilum]OHE97159.1 hypothetical protein CORC01_07600 [Colletotrichum orchidophilum]